MSVKESAAGGLTGLLHEAHETAVAIGPVWGFAFLLAILLLFPQIGVIPQLARLFKEDRVDARKQKVESERLAYKYRNRPQPPTLPKQPKQPQLPKQPGGQD